MMATVIGVAKDLFREATDALVEAARFIPEDKLHWRPSESARSTMEILIECAVVQDAAARLLRGEQVSMDDDMPAPETYPTLASIEPFIAQTHDAVLAALDDVDPGRFDDVVTMPWGAQKPLAHVMMLPASHNSYHGGQINYIQTLLGDTEFH